MDDHTTKNNNEESEILVKSSSAETGGGAASGATSAEARSGSTKTKHNDDSNNTLNVKKEYVLDKRSSSLRPLSLSSSGNDDDRRGNNNSNNNDGGGGGRENKRIDDRDNPNNPKNNKRSRRRNKKRPRDVRQSNAEKICLSTLKGESCEYGSKCRFSHDLKAFMCTRPVDIQEIKGGCPIFNQVGYCVYGATCRLGSCHITKTGDNIDKRNLNTETTTTSNSSDVLPLNDQALNVLPRDIQTQLRKKTYPFKCQRYNQNNNKNSGEGKKKEAEAGKATDSLKTTATKKDDDGNTEEGNGAAEESVTMTATAEKKTVVDKETKESLMEVEANSSSKEGDKNQKAPPPSSASSSSNNNIFGPIETKPRRIIDFFDKVYVAPLTTVGNLPFRRIVKQYGADITCGEMALATNLLEGKPSEWALLKRHPSEDVFGIQVASAHADQLTRVSELIENHCQVDFVDLNLGCPIDLICSKGAGAALMMRDKKLKGILSGMTSTLSCPVTVKMRTGWDINKPFAHDLVPKIQSWKIDGLSTIMIHGRSRLQRYQRLADWEYINKVAASQSNEYPKIPIIGNGDIFSYTDYEEKMKTLGADCGNEGSGGDPSSNSGVSRTAMLARGALIKPWLPTEIKERRHWDISANERLDILKDFVKFGLEHWGSDQQGVNNTRRFLLEWLSFLHRYVPVGLLEAPPQQMSQRPPHYLQGRNDLETLFLSANSSDWIQISEMLLGPVPDGFQFEPKHRANGYA